MPNAYERLKRWRDVGDGPISYTAGDGNFGADVKWLLGEVDQLRRYCSAAAEQVRAGEGGEIENAIRLIRENGDFDAEQKRKIVAIVEQAKR